MQGKFVPFDELTIIAELRKLPVEDRAKLYRAMSRYADLRLGDEPFPAVVKDYGKGIWMIRHASHEAQGRLLFCKKRMQNDTKFVILVVYKKETQSVPARILRTAIDRKKLGEK